MDPLETPDEPTTPRVPVLERLRIQLDAWMTRVAPHSGVPGRHGSVRYRLHARTLHWPRSGRPPWVVYQGPLILAILLFVLIVFEPFLTYKVTSSNPPDLPRTSEE